MWLGRDVLINQTVSHNGWESEDMGQAAFSRMDSGVTMRAHIVEHSMKASMSSTGMTWVVALSKSPLGTATAKVTYSICPRHIQMELQHLPGTI